jgi:hypothetical protein
MRNLILSAVVITTLVSCGPSTKIEKSWMEPGASVSSAAPNKALVIAMVKDETSRRVIEDQLVKRLTTPAVSSYTIISTEMLKEASDAALKQKLTEGSFTHVLLMRLADVEKETSYVPVLLHLFMVAMVGIMVMGPACILLPVIILPIKTIL